MKLYRFARFDRSLLYGFGHRKFTRSNQAPWLRWFIGKYMNGVLVPVVNGVWGIESAMVRLELTPQVLRYVETRAYETYCLGLPEDYYIEDTKEYITSEFGRLLNERAQQDARSVAVVEDIDQRYREMRRSERRSESHMDTVNRIAQAQRVHEAQTESLRQITQAASQTQGTEYVSTYEPFSQRLRDLVHRDSEKATVARIQQEGLRKTIHMREKHPAMYKITIGRR